MSFDLRDVLTEFAEAGDLSTRARRGSGVFRHVRTPEVFKAMQMAAHAARQAARYWDVPGERERRIEYSRYRYVIEKARAEQDDRLRRAARVETARQAKEAKERADAPSKLLFDRIRCAACRKKMPGEGWCPAHTDERMTMHEKREKLPDDRKGITHHFTILAKGDPHEARVAELESVIRATVKFLDDAAAGNTIPREATTAMLKFCYKALEGGSTPEGVREIKGYIQTGYYPTPTATGRVRLGEIFVRVGKAGSTDAMYDQWAIAASMALQYGVPVRELFRKFVASRFEPAGFIVKSGNQVPGADGKPAQATSILDYVGRWVIENFAEPEAVGGEAVQAAGGAR